MRAKYAVSRIGRESQVPGLFTRGKAEFIPDFMVRKAVERPGSDRPLHQLIPIEVKYRYDISKFLQREAGEFLDRARRWTDLRLVLVTDHPDADRSCFQVVDCCDGDGRSTRDLDEVAAFDIYRSTVVEYEHLATKLFDLLARSR